jgi:hypothetical protein
MSSVFLLRGKKWKKKWDGFLLCGKRTRSNPFQSYSGYATTGKEFSLFTTRYIHPKELFLRN